MTITPFDRNSFHVSSESGELPYLVDLEEFDGNGKCDCMDFKCKLEPQIDDGRTIRKPKQRLACKHIRFVLQVLEHSMKYEQAKEMAPTQG